ncbi:MAG TPA: CDP-diacylglycerol diphosphatase [Trebonia sp.]|nr:CDP-diacylglycerol diphosphatase [Trebonia sp.]
MGGSEEASGKVGELPRRQFVRLSGVAGTAAFLAGTGTGKNLAPVTSGACPPGAAPCPAPSALCGHPGDSGPRVFLWEAVQVCEGTKPPPPFVVSLQTTPNYVILHGNPRTEHNFLLVPSCRISGIECPFIWGPTAYPGYWNDAWEQAQPGGAAPVKYPSIGLGINSTQTRQQDQLHIHMAGILSGVQGQLNALEAVGRITSDRAKWPVQVVPVTGRDPKTGNAVTRHYRALILRDKTDLRENLFMLLGDHVPEAAMHRADQMLVVTPRSAGGFYVLNSDPVSVPGGGTGTADFLLVYA